MIIYCKFRLSYLGVKKLRITRDMHIVRKFMEKMKANPRDNQWSDFFYTKRIMWNTKALVMSHRTCNKFLRKQQKQLDKCEAKIKEMMRKKRSCVV